MFLDDIPLPRGNAAIWSSITVMLASFTYMFFSTEVKFIVQEIMFQLFLSFVTISVLKLCEFLEEYRHIPSRYKSYWKALNASLDLKKNGCGVVFSALFYYLLLECKNEDIGFLRSLAWEISLSCFCYLFLKVFRFLDPTPAEISEICEKNHFNVAHGLAWSYYIGYLKLILPNLEERIKKYQHISKNIPEYKKKWKLYILIPFSCKIHDKLEKMDSRIKFFGNLPELCVDRAGIKARSYKNSIYSIYDQKDKIHYCILEYATPLRSLFEMSNDATAAFSKEQRRQQAKLFYSTLKTILNNSVECTGYFRLIPYDDDLEEGKIDSHFLTTTILDHMQQEGMEYIVPEQTTWEESSNDSLSSEEQLMISKSDDPQPLQSMNY
ncbi:stimulator of interferon genes protein [Heptranchias perlo]|uniref:stimulator of interferon genes protein n=1 Tax=Heptranchias perlo TaxID=212740 RepID=UPI0035595848